MTKLPLLEPFRKPPPEGVFELGLCMAGAISAGAYTAGVLDYLIEALDAFAAERTTRQGKGHAPLHEVRLLALGGASAGGICSAIASMFLDKRFAPVRPETPAAERRGNPLWRAWVEAIDIHQLLGTRDARPGQKLASLLDCTVLEEIVDTLLDARPAMATAQRPWLADPLRSILTLSNLRGVPYGLRFGNENAFRLWMTSHADYVRYAVPLDKDTGAAPGDPRSQGETLLLRDLPRGAARDGFKAIVLGTSAFPLALAPRVLSRDIAEYELRAAETATSGLQHLSHGEPLPGWTALTRPDFAPDHMPEPYQALCVDGGAMNNQPLELVRQALAGWAGQNPREPSRASRATILIEPFVNKGTLGPVQAGGLLDTLLPLFNALVANSRFMPEDLALAAAENIASRYMIAPSRGKSWRGEGAIASGYLGGFLGFFDQAYREHDFFLGRRNARAFLQWIFLLPEDNELFADNRWHEADKRTWTVVDTENPTTGPRMLPILPLCGELRTREEPLPVWPAGAFAPDSIRGALKGRAQLALPDLRRSLIEALPGTTRWAGLVDRVISLADPILTHRVVDAAMKKIAAEVAVLDSHRGV